VTGTALQAPPVNGFHDTANAAATVICTPSLPAELAVVWSGVFNFPGVLTSTGAVAFGDPQEETTRSHAALGKCWPVRPARPSAWSFG